jgi:hypothetical protein
MKKELFNRYADAIVDTHSAKPLHDLSLEIGASPNLEHEDKIELLKKINEQFGAMNFGMAMLNGTLPTKGKWDV